MITDTIWPESNRDEVTRWLRPLAHGWSLVRAKYLMHEIDRRSETGDEQLLSLTKVGVVPRSEIGDAAGRADSLIGYKVVESGELVMNKMQAWNGMFGLSAYDGLVSPDYSVFRVLSSVDARWLTYLLRSSFYSGQFLWRSRGMGTAFLRLHPENLLDTPIVTPPPTIQSAIADYLDQETARIDALIAAKHRMIELLNERDLVLVSTILFPDGVPTVRLGYLATLQTGLTVDAAREPGPSAVTRPYLRVANVQSGWLDLSEISEVTIAASLASRSTLRPGDVLMTEGGDLDKLGRGTVWQGQLNGCLHQNHIFAVRPDPKQLDPVYLALVTRTTHARRYFESTGARTTNLASTNSEKILGLSVPNLALTEQSKLVAMYEASSRSLQELRSDVETQIRLLNERRQALATVAVTGEMEIQRVVA
jgi:type I restriction enzyme S subunit